MKRPYASSKTYIGFALLFSLPLPCFSLHKQILSTFNDLNLTFKVDNLEVQCSGRSPLKELYRQVSSPKIGRPFIVQLLHYLGSHDIKYILWSRNKLCRWKQQGVMHQVISCLSKHGLISASIVLHPLKQLCHILSLMVLQSNTPQAQPYGVRQERLHLANFLD